MRLVKNLSYLLEYVMVMCLWRAGGVSHARMLPQTDEYCGLGFSFLMTEICFSSLSFCVAVERELVQKRTFTRWINLHLEKVCG